MDKTEVIITTAKEIFLKYYKYEIREHATEEDLSKIDQVFKAITKTVAGAFKESVKDK